MRPVHRDGNDIDRSAGDNVGEGAGNDIDYDAGTVTDYDAGNDIDRSVDNYINHSVGGSISDDVRKRYRCGVVYYQHRGFHGGGNGESLPSGRREGHYLELLQPRGYPHQGVQ